MKNVYWLLLLCLCCGYACQNSTESKHKQATENTPKQPVENAETPAENTPKKNVSDSTRQTSEKPTLSNVDSLQQVKTSPSKATKKNRFKVAVENMKSINYVLKTYEEIAAFQNFLNQRIKHLNKYRLRQQKPLLDTVMSVNIVQVRKAFVKGTVNLGGNIYARATLESWEFDSVAAAAAMEKQVAKLENQGHAWQDISKSPISYVRVANELVFITPGGFYMLDKVGEIKAFFRKHL